MLISLLFSNPALFLVWVVAIVFGITIHEFSHAFAAYKMGDSTAKYMGRLTLNPLKHMDVVGFLMLVLVGFGWGKPVPFNPYNLRYKRFGPAIVAIAGPLANLAALIVFGLALRVIVHYTDVAAENLLVQLVLFMVQLNLILIVFNLLPIPPLDGSKILYSILPASKQNVVVFLEKYGIYFLLAIVIFGSSLLLWLFNYFYQIILNVLVL